MRLLYSIAIGFYALAVRIAALFNSKAKLLATGWKGWNEYFRNSESILKDSKVAWFHASSLGEFEQARPVMESFRKGHPEYKLCLTFFSPSGYEIRKNYSGADLVYYLPPDTRRNARELVRLIHPDIAFFVKYDFWFNCLQALSHHNGGTPTYLFSAIFRPNQYFFRWYGSWFARQLKAYTHIFVQNSQSLNLLKSINLNDVTLAGDTRYDRVHDIALNAKPIPAIERFLDQSSNQAIKQSSNHTLVAGSSWEPDEENIKLFLDSYNEPLNIILAPHVISESHLAFIEKLFGKQNCIRFSSISDSDNNTLSQSRILIIDNIGMLSSIYRYATVAYVGGGFGKGIHNILEATAYNTPVCFGPNYHKFKEAHDMIAAGGAKSYSSPEQLTEILNLWLGDQQALQQASTSCQKVMNLNIGSTDIILQTIKTE